ncbi:MAG: hypothetical protein WB053_11280, partial [Nitrososphaeraceae archaeon]
INYLTIIRYDVVLSWVIIQDRVNAFPTNKLIRAEREITFASLIYILFILGVKNHKLLLVYC